MSDIARAAVTAGESPASSNRAPSLAIVKFLPVAASPRYRRREREAQASLPERRGSGNKQAMEQTRYFIEQVMRKRPYLSLAMCEAVLQSPLRTEIQSDGRLRHWGRVNLPAERKARILRVVTLDDGTTVHNAFIDRNFDEDRS